MVSRKNYAFERNQRAKAKAAKRQAKLAEKAARSRADLGQSGNDGAGDQDAGSHTPADNDSGGRGS